LPITQQISAALLKISKNHNFKKKFMAEIIRTQNGIYHFNVYDDTKGVNVLLPAVIIYKTQNFEEEIEEYLAIEYVECPKEHFKKFNPHFLKEITKILVHPIFEENEYSFEDDKRELRQMLEVLKREIEFKYDIEEDKAN
jgi:hypothetical protein